MEVKAGSLDPSKLRRILDIPDARFHIYTNSHGEVCAERTDHRDPWGSNLAGISDKCKAADVIKMRARVEVLSCSKAGTKVRRLKPGCHESANLPTRRI